MSQFLYAGGAELELFKQLMQFFDNSPEIGGYLAAFVLVVYILVGKILPMAWKMLKYKNDRIAYIQQTEVDRMEALTKLRDGGQEPAEAIKTLSREVINLSRELSEMRTKKNQEIDAKDTEIRQLKADNCRMSKEIESLIKRVGELEKELSAFANTGEKRI